MLAYISVNGGAASGPRAAMSPAVANPDTYNSVIPGQTLAIRLPNKGVIANDVNVYGVRSQLPRPRAWCSRSGRHIHLHAQSVGPGRDSFIYCANGGMTVVATVTLGAAPIESGSGITVNPDAYTSNVATALSIKSPGVLANDSDAAGYPLKVNEGSVGNFAGPGTLTVNMDKTGSFNASVTAPGTYTFTYKAQNSQGTVSSSSCNSDA